MPGLPVLAIILLASVALIVFYMVLYGLPMRTNETAKARLNDLYNDRDPNIARTSLILRGREVDEGWQAVVIWMSDYEKLDRRRYVITRPYEDYLALEARWRQVWQVGDYDDVQGESSAAFAQKLDDLKADGWRVELDMPFSDIDRLVYLSLGRED